MLLVLLAALSILIFALVTHYNQHFQFQRIESFQISKSVSSSHSRINTSSIRRLPKLSIDDKKYKLCCCMLLPVDGETFDFFPMSFLLYLSFLTILCILIIIGRLLNYYYYKNNETAIDLLLGYSIQSLENNSIKSMLSMTTIKTGQDRIMDYILMYGIMISSVWVSLFSFYRYYTTLKATTKLVDKVSTKKILSKFAVYAVIFCILFILQIHVWYLLWYYIVLFFVFNVYCTYKFAAMLIKQYKVFMNLAMTDVMRSNEQILKSVKFTKNTSLICCILHSINLSLFACTYNTNVIYYLPIIWSISALMLTLNFVRNRRFLRAKLAEIKHNIYSNASAKPVIAHKRNHKPMIKTCSNIQTQKQLAISIEMTDMKEEPTIELIKSNSYTPIESNPEYIIPLQQPNIILNKSKSLETYNLQFHKHGIPSIKRAYSSPTNACQEYEDIELNISEHLKTMKTINFKLPDIITEMPDTNMNDIAPSWSRQKAFELLGVAPSTPVNKIMITNMNNYKSKSPTLTKLRQLSGISKLSSTSSNENYQNMRDAEQDNTPTELEPEPTSLHLNITPLFDERIEKQSVTNFTDATVSINQLDKEITSSVNMSNAILHSMPDKMRLKHIKSSSEPNMDDMFVSLNILASFGFCSRASISSLRLLNQKSNMDAQSRQRSVTTNVKGTKNENVETAYPTLIKSMTIR